MSSNILDKEYGMAAITDRLTLAIQGVAARTAAHSTTKPVTRRPKPTSLLVTSGTELLVLSLATRATSVLAKGFTLPVGVALDASGRTADVADLDTGAGTYTIVAVPVRKKPKLTKIHMGTGIPGQLAGAAPPCPLTRPTYRSSECFDGLLAANCSRALHLG
jgi:hypothetical protein